VSRRTILWIVASAIVLHLGLFLIFARMPALPKVKYIPPPNFGYKEETYDDPKTGERTIYREIRVSTKLADPEKLPPPAPAPATTP
jgi:hypothetical protein